MKIVLKIRAESSSNYIDSVRIICYIHVYDPNINCNAPISYKIKRIEGDLNLTYKNSRRA